MIAEHISLEHLPRILSNKPLLEHFLSALLDKTVQLWTLLAERNAVGFLLSIRRSVCPIKRQDAGLSQRKPVRPETSGG